MGRKTWWEESRACSASPGAALTLLFLFQASVFFSFPDGSGIKFKLQGTAGPPKVEDTIVCELPAKTRHTVALCVHNWLPKKQQ